MNGINYGAFLGIILTGVALILAFITVLLARKEPKIFATGIFLERRKIVRALKILLIGIIMLTADIVAHIFHYFNFIGRGIYMMLSIICGSGLALSFIAFFYENIRIMMKRRKKKADSSNKFR